MKTATVNLTLRDLTHLLNSLRDTGGLLMRKVGDDAEDAHDDLMMIDDLISRLKVEHTRLFEAKIEASAPPSQTD